MLQWPPWGDVRVSRGGCVQGGSAQRGVCLGVCVCPGGVCVEGDVSRGCGCPGGVGVQGVWVSRGCAGVCVCVCVCVLFRRGVCPGGVCSGVCVSMGVCVCTPPLPCGADFLSRARKRAITITHLLFTLIVSMKAEKKENCFVSRKSCFFLFAF